MLYRACAAATVAFVLQTASYSLPQDAFEPNDDCAAPPVILPGTPIGLTIGPDPDYFAFDVPANASIQIEASSSTVAPTLTLFELGCGSPLATATGQPLDYFDCGGTPRQLVVFVEAPAASSAPYDLEIDVVEIVDDPFEDNDDCQSGSLIAITSFTTPGLVVTGCDEDYFVARLQRAGVQIQVDLLFDPSLGDIDVEILEFQNGGCTGNVLASSTSTTDNESVTYVNATNPSAAEAVVLRIFMKSGGDFNTYALTACFGDITLFPLIGEQGCVGAVNNSGRPATLCASGSLVAADNSVSFYVVDLPMNALGYFITSPNTNFVANPGGSLGNLCLGASGRYSSQVLNAGLGSVFFQPDLTTIPVAGGGSTVLLPGDRQNWQFWHRDATSAGVSSSNFSSAIGITFQ